MVFSSPVFIFLFLPVVYLINLAIPKHFSNGLLLIFSLLFYAWGEPLYVFLMIVSSLVNYLLTLRLDRSIEHRKVLLIFATIFNVGILALFKYADFLILTINGLFNTGFEYINLPLPIGISFYTFQTMSYVFDVYRFETPVQKNYLHLLLYITFFPQLIAGPIVKYHDISEQIVSRSVSLVQTTSGLRRFVFGLSKKVLIANTMAVIADRLFALPPSDISTGVAWLAAIAYLFQIYFDFSGYSDMAIGLGRMFGFHFKENFNYPYIATSMQDFWRRWHISLSSWFRLYVYHPLGGSRKSKKRAIINRILVFFLTGLWHGASWTFVVWGLYHGLFLMLEQTVFNVGRWPVILRRVYTLLIVLVGFVIFRSETFAQSMSMIQAMFVLTASNQTAIKELMILWNPFNIIMMIISSIASVPIAQLIQKSLPSVLPERLTYGWAVLLWFACLLSLAANTYNPFIYFRF